MPTKAKRPCPHPGCPTLTAGGRCEPHRLQARRVADQRRDTAAARGYDWTWHQARTAWLASHPLCETCLTEDRFEPATVVDHVIPHRGDRVLFWDPANWSAKCKACHDRKTATQDGGFRGTR